jgi:hypothetical protein
MSVEHPAPEGMARCTIPPSCAKRRNGAFRNVALGAAKCRFTCRRRREESLTFPGKSEPRDLVSYESAGGPPFASLRAGTALRAVPTFHRQ